MLFVFFKLISLIFMMMLVTYLCIQYYMVSSMGKSFYLKLQDHDLPKAYLGDIQSYDIEQGIKFSPLGFYYHVQMDSAKKKHTAKVELHPSMDLKAIHAELIVFADDKTSEDFKMTVTGDYLGALDLIHAASSGYKEMLSRLQKIHIVVDGEINAFEDKVDRVLRVENWDITVSSQDQAIHHFIGGLLVYDDTEDQVKISTKNLSLNMTLNLDGDYDIQDLLRVDKENLLALRYLNLKADHVFYQDNWHDYFGNHYHVSKEHNDMFLQIKLDEQETLNFDFDAGGTLLGIESKGPNENIKYKGLGAKFQIKLAQGKSFEDILTNAWDAIDNAQLYFTAKNMVHFYSSGKSVGDDDVISEYEDYKFTSRVENIKSQKVTDVLVSSEFGSAQVYLDKRLPLEKLHPQLYILAYVPEKSENFEFLRALGKYKTKDSVRVRLYDKCFFYFSQNCDQFNNQIIFQSSLQAKDGGVSQVYDVNVDFDVKNIHEIGLHGNVEEWLKNDNLNIKIIMKGKNFIDDQYHKELASAYKAVVDDFNDTIGLDLIDNEPYRNYAVNVSLVANKITLFGQGDWLLIDSTFKKNINDNVKGYTLSARSDPLEMGVIPDQYLHVDLSGDYGIEKFLPIKLFSEDERESALSLIKSKDKDQLKVIIEGESAHRIINGVKFNCGGLFTFSECKLVKSN